MNGRRGRHGLSFLSGDVGEIFGDLSRDLEDFHQSRRGRKKVEKRFAHIKRILKLDRLRLRGFGGARDGVPLAATAQNLRRRAKLHCRAPPVPAAYRGLSVLSGIGARDSQNGGAA